MSVAIVAPVEGALLDLEHDEDPGAAGIQVTVEVSLQGTTATWPGAGALGTLLVQGQDGETSTPFPAAGEGQPRTVSVTLGGGARALVARFPDACGGILESLPVHVTVSLPAVSSMTVSANDLANDAPGLVRLTSTLEEGTVLGMALRTTVSVQAQGAPAGTPVELVSDLPVPGSVVGVAALDASLRANVVATLAQGVQTLRGRLGGDPAEPSTDGALTVAVDFSPGHVEVSPPLAAPYTGRDGLVVEAGAPGHVDDELRTAVVVTFGDDQPVVDGRITLSRLGAGDAVLATETLVLTGDPPQVTFAGFPLVAGANRLRAAFVDAAGNPQVSADQLYRADPYGPTLALGVAGADGTVLPCGATLAEACPADVLAPAGGRSLLDRAASDTYSPTLRDPPGYQGGTRLLYTLVECSNSSGEPCDATLRLEWRPAGSGLVFAPVEQASLRVTSDHAVPAELPPGVALPPGRVLELRLAATDPHGNVGLSSPVFLALDEGGVRIELERVRDGAPVGAGDVVEDGRHFGLAANEDTSGASFRLDLRARLGTDGPSLITRATLSVNGGPPLGADAFGGMADFDDVALPSCSGWPDEQPFSLAVAVECDGTPCGERTYTGLVADVAAPTYEFSRCSLCALGVPLADPAVYGTLCGSCAAATRYDAGEKIAASPAAALWNVAGDQDGDPGNGFTIGAGASPRPLVAITEGAEPGTRVTLVSSQGPLAGATATVSGCAAGRCLATWNDLHLPSLGGAGEHVLSLSFTDAAGNPAGPHPARAPEQIHARVDPVPPARVAQTVCIGESTTPSDVGEAATDLRTFESPLCAARCTATGACSRRGGRATVVWQAPADDGARGARASGYELVYAALGIRYRTPDDVLGTAIEDCSQLSVANGVEGTIALASAADPGGLEHAAIDGLYPHRAYCFRVAGIDDAGNRASGASGQLERVLPLLTYPGVVSFDAFEGADDFEPAAGTPTTLYASDAAAVGARASNLGDLDGDGRDDLAVLSQAEENAILVFLSRDEDGPPSTPSAVIGSPAAGPRTLNGAMAGGDFDGDGFSDLAVCAATLDTTAPGTPGGEAGGALYLYYGSAAGPRTDDNPAVGGDPLLPSKVPDVALLGPAGAVLCSRVVIADVDGVPGAELIVASSSGTSGTVDPKVYGFRGGSRARFPGTPPATAKVWLDLTTGAGAGTTETPDFAIGGRTLPARGNFPGPLEAADVTGDGVQDLLVADPTASHDLAGTCPGCGELYVYEGGAGLTGEIAGADAAPAQLLQTVRYARDANGDGVTDSSQLGGTLLRVREPEGPGTPDWVLARVQGPAGRWRVIAFRGKAGVGLVPPASEAGVSVFPPGGLPAADYSELDSTTWDFAQLTGLGASMAFVGALDGHGGPDVLVGTGSFGRTVLLYSFDPEHLRFEKRTILKGADGFGAAVLGAGNHLGAAAAPQLLVTKSSIVEERGRVFVFR